MECHSSPDLPSWIVKNCLQSLPACFYCSKSAHSCQFPSMNKFKGWLGEITAWRMQLAPSLQDPKLGSSFAFWQPLPPPSSLQPVLISPMALNANLLLADTICQWFSMVFRKTGGWGGGETLVHGSWGKRVWGGSLPTPTIFYWNQWEWTKKAFQRQTAIRTRRSIWRSFCMNPTHLIVLSPKNDPKKIWSKCSVSFFAHFYLGQNSTPFIPIWKRYY